jgi:hypothetical protein
MTLSPKPEPQTEFPAQELKEIFPFEDYAISVSPNAGIKGNNRNSC